MFFRTLFATVMLALPAWAQPVAAPDCTVDVTVGQNLKLEVVYRCRSTTALSFEPDDQQVAAQVSGFAGGKIEPVNGLLEARYRYDLDGFSKGSIPDLVDWARRTAQAEANYWQGFTAKQMMVGLVPMPRAGVGYGRTVSGGGATVMVEVGATVEPRRLFNDWVLVHELIHTGMPYIRGRATWFMEGAATYVEPIIRARAGWNTQEEGWTGGGDSSPEGLR